MHTSTLVALEGPERTNPRDRIPARLAVAVAENSFQSFVPTARRISALGELLPFVKYKAIGQLTLPHQAQSTS